MFVVLLVIHHVAQQDNRGKLAMDSEFQFFPKAQQLQPIQHWLPSISMASKAFWEINKGRIITTTTKTTIKIGVFICKVWYYVISNSSLSYFCFAMFRGRWRYSRPPTISNIALGTFKCSWSSICVRHRIQCLWYRHSYGILRLWSEMHTKREVKRTTFSNDKMNFVVLFPLCYDDSFTIRMRTAILGEIGASMGLS